MVETFRRDAWAELGVDVEFVQHNHSRSARGHPARPPLPDRARPGEAGPLPARGDLRRRRRPAPRLAHLRPVGGLRPRRRDPPPALRPGRLRPRLRRASATSPTSPTCSPALYDPATEAGIAWDDPDVGVEWPVDEPLLSERDKAAAGARRAVRAGPARPGTGHRAPRPSGSRREPARAGRTRGAQDGRRRPTRPSRAARSRQHAAVNQCAVSPAAGRRAGAARRGVGQEPRSSRSALDQRDAGSGPRRPEAGDWAARRPCGGCGDPRLGASGRRLLRFRLL